MNHGNRRPLRGFTMIELAIVLAISAVITALAWSNIWRLRPRAQLADASSEIVALVHGARQHALATGNDVVVMIFPQFATARSSGKVIVYEDGNASLLTEGSALTFDGYDPAALRAGDRSQVVAEYELPRNVIVGPALGAGSTDVLVAPLAGIPINIDCSFCKVDGDRRGAIRFDSRGRAYFYSGNGQPTANAVGGSLSLAAPEVGGQRTLIVTSGTGSVTLRNQGG